MQTAPINPAMMAGTMGITGATGTAATQTETGGDFAAVFMQLVGQKGGLGGFAEVDKIFGGTDEGTQNAMEMLAALFMQTPAGMNLAENQLQAQGEAAQAVMLAAQQSEVQRLAMLGLQQPAAQQTKEAVQQGATGYEQLLAAQQVVATGGNQPLTTEQMAANKRAAQNDALSGSKQDEQLFKPVVEASTQQKPVEVTGKSADTLNSAYSRLYQIKAPASDKRAAGESGELDIDALQQAVDSGAYLRQTAGSKEAGMARQIYPKDIAQQVQTGIVQNLGKGKDEFVIRLKPEGLGEITVKMAETAGKISISIITSNQHTQNALSGELGALREALKPYNAEIQQVVANDNASFGQQQGMGEHRHGQNGEQRGSFVWEKQNEARQEPEQYTQYLESALNTYI